MARYDFNPWDPASQGFALADAFAKTQDAEMLRQKAIEEQQAMLMLGQQPDLLGYEGVPGAQRQPWAAQLYSANPELAFRLEQQQALPFAMSREAQKAGEIERKRKEADAAIFSEMARKLGFFTQAGIAPTAGPQAIPAQWPSESGADMPNVGVVPESSRPLAPSSPEQPATRPANLSDPTERTMEYSFTQGPKFVMKTMAPAELALRQAQSDREERTTKLSEQEFPLKRSDYATKLTREAQKAEDEADKRVYAVMKDISDLQTKMGNNDVTPAQGSAGLALLQRELGIAIKARDDLRYGPNKMPTDINDYQMPPEKPSASLRPTMQATGSSAQPRMMTPQLRQVVPHGTPQTGQPSGPNVGAGLNYKQGQELKKKFTEEKFTLANKAIEDANMTAAKGSAAAEHMIALKNLLATKDIGHPLYNFGLPFSGEEGPQFGEKLAELRSQDNQELITRSRALIPMIIKEGQSQLYNTIPEVKIQTSEFPNVKNRPDVNRKLFATVWNKWQASLEAGKFLEQWQATHQGSLDGARKVFADWMKYNPSLVAETENGKTSLRDQAQVPIEKWAILTQKFTPQEIMEKRKREVGR